MRTGTLYITDEWKEDERICIFQSDFKQEPEIVSIPHLFERHFDELSPRKALRVEIETEGSTLEACKLLDATLVCTMCELPYTELIPLETVLSGLYCSVECMDDAARFEDRMSRED